MAPGRMPCVFTAPPNNLLVDCNQCGQQIPNEHYHCSICDTGDYDLCNACVDAGHSCPGENHWLIKRFRHPDGAIGNSQTQRLPPKPKQGPGLQPRVRLPGASGENVITCGFAAGRAQLRKEASESLAELKVKEKNLSSPAAKAMLHAKLLDLGQPPVESRTCNVCLESKSAAIIDLIITNRTLQAAH